MSSKAASRRTVVDSVARVDGRVAEADACEVRLVALRQRHRGAIFERYLDRVPTTTDTTYVSPTATIVGDVRLAADVSVWFGCVVRGDVNTVEVRERSNVQDGTVIHLGDSDATFIAEDVVIGHRAVIHGCRIGGGVLVGIGATVLDGAVVGEGSIIGAGAVVTAGTQIPARSLVLGTPGRVVRTLTAADESFHRALAGKYTRLAHNYRIG